jgi:hypothetical protein
MGRSADHQVIHFIAPVWDGGRAEPSPARILLAARSDATAGNELALVADHELVAAVSSAMLSLSGGSLARPQSTDRPDVHELTCGCGD